MRNRFIVICTAAVLGILGAGLASSQTSRSRRPVTQAGLDQWKKELSNWGRWGAADEKGTLNLITPTKRKAAARLVEDGTVVSLARDAATEKAIDTGQPYVHVMESVGRSSSVDRFSVFYHGLAHTHLDALGHHFHEGKVYNGFSRDEWVTMDGGVRKGSIHNVKEGVFTRGILFDIPRLKGVPYLEPSTPIYVEDLEAWEEYAGVKVSPGDAIFIRTGRWTRRDKLGPWEMKMDAGLDVSVIPWLRERDVALIGTESAVDVMPIPSIHQITNPDDARPVHNFALVALGMNVFDNCMLDELAAAAAVRKRWAFLLTAAPLPIVNGTGSPINPIAIF